MDRGKLLDAYDAVYDVCSTLITDYNAAFVQQENNEDLIKQHEERDDAANLHKIAPYITESEMHALDEKIGELIKTAPDRDTASVAAILQAICVIGDVSSSLWKAYSALLVRNAAVLKLLNAIQSSQIKTWANEVRQQKRGAAGGKAIATLDAILCALDEKKTQR